MEIGASLVEYEHTTEEIYANSGLIFSDKYVLITANTLVPHLVQNNLLNSLEKIIPGKLNFENIPNIKLKVIYNRHNTKVYQSASIVANFVCKNILFSTQKYLKEWSFDGENNFNGRQVLPLFFILQLECDMFQKLHLMESLGSLLQVVERCEFLSGQEVFTKSTPFGNRMFLDSYSQGVISNVFGENFCFLLIDCPAAPGSEGSPVFLHPQSSNYVPIGIVISCLNWWKGEWVGLTLVASLKSLLRQLLGVTEKNFSQPQTLNFAENPKSILEYSEKSLIQVVSGSSWGTGILLDKNKGLFITNSHVIENEDITLRWRNIELKGTVLYKTPSGQVYDVAIIQCDDLVTLKDLDMVNIEVSERSLLAGEEVYGVGFPLFESKLRPSVSITRGHISQIHKSMLKTTCNILPGSSGGAILSSNGQLLGIIVSNTKLGKVVFPRFNMAIPSKEIYYIVKRFILTGDLKVLKLLHNNDPIIGKPWTSVMGKL